MSLDLKDLGLTQEELQEKVVERICDRFLMVSVVDEEGTETEDHSQFAGKVKDLVKARIDQKVGEMFRQHIEPKVSDFIENLVLQETNAWGEKRGVSITFLEYLTQRASAYLTEKVNYQGKAKGEDSYSWTGTQTRIAHLVHEHLQYHIERAMQAAVKAANDSIVQGLEATVKIKLAEIASALKVNIKTA